MNRHGILVVDDDESIRDYLFYSLSLQGQVVDRAESGEQALQRIEAGFSPAVILLDVILPGMSGLETLKRIKAFDPAVPVILLSAMDETRTVVDAMKMGASDYLVKPVAEEELEAAIARLQYGEEPKHAEHSADTLEGQDAFLSCNPRMLRIKAIAKQVADTDVPVLISGESGVGKEVVARFICGQSRRPDQPFVKVNCAALPVDLLESELFGYEKGAFTGALRDKPGQFELADKGCILLDEIGEMSTPLQAKLLHVLQDGEYTRLGAKRPIRVSARVLASTNRRIEEAVGEGQFREDLYFRLNVIRLEIPPLRERREDIPLLCNHFMHLYREKYGSPVQQLPAKLMVTFLGYRWPGNIRQLENAIKRYLILQDLDGVLAEFETGAVDPIAGPSKVTTMPLKELAGLAAEQAEKEVVLRALKEVNWNRKQAARRLGICYKGLLNKLKKWQLDVPAHRGVAPSEESIHSDLPEHYSRIAA